MPRTEFEELRREIWSLEKELEQKKKKVFDLPIDSLINCDDKHTELSEASQKLLAEWKIKNYDPIGHVLGLSRLELAPVRNEIKGILFLIFCHRGREYDDILIF